MKYVGIEHNIQCKWNELKLKAQVILHANCDTGSQ